MTPRIEIWNSDQSQEERHYFMPNEANTYIFGYNPTLISSATAERVVALLLAEATPLPESS